jgi:hypothetical protein
MAQIAVENKNLLSSNVGNYKTIILGGTDDLEDLACLDGSSGLMVVHERKDHHGGGRHDSALGTGSPPVSPQGQS